MSNLFKECRAIVGAMTTNHMGLEQALSDGELTVITDTDHVQCGDAAAMACELLAYRKASKEPIGEVRLVEYDDNGSHPDARVVCLHSHADWDNFANGFKLFAAPPLQAVTVPDALVFHPNQQGYTDGYVFGWNNCRATMLKGESK